MLGLLKAILVYIFYLTVKLYEYRAILAFTKAKMYLEENLTATLFYWAWYFLLENEKPLILKFLYDKMLNNGSLSYYVVYHVKCVGNTTSSHVWLIQVIKKNIKQIERSSIQHAYIYEWKMWSNPLKTTLKYYFWVYWVAYTTTATLELKSCTFSSLNNFEQVKFFASLLTFSSPLFLIIITQTIPWLCIYILLELGKFIIWN